MEAHKAFKGVYLWVVGTWNPLILPFFATLVHELPTGLEKMVTRNANVFQKTFAFNSHHAGGLYVDVLLFQVFPIRSAEKDKKLPLLA